MPTQKNNILEFNQYMKSDKMLYMIHSDIEPLIEKTDNSNNDLEKSSTTKKKKQKIYFVVIQCQLFGHFII